MFENNNRISRFLSSGYFNAVVLFIAVFRFFQFGIGNCTSVSREWQAYELCSNYSYGFIKRSLLGTLVKLLSAVTGLEFKSTVTVFMNVEEFLFSFALLGLCFFVINKYKNPSVNLLILFLLSSDILGFYYSDWGEPDIVMMTLAIVIGIMIVREEYVWLVPFIASACVLIHEGFVMMYFGMVVALLLVQCLRKKGAERLRYFAILMTTGFMCGCLSAYFYFFTKHVINVGPYQFVGDAVQKLGESVNASYLIESFWNAGPGILNSGSPGYSFWLRMYAIASVCIVLSPFIVNKFRFWREMIKGESDKLMKLAYLFCSLIFVFALPLVVSQADEARWFYAVVFQEVMLIIFLFMMDKEKAGACIGRYMKPSLFNVMLSVFYLLLFSNPNKQFIDMILVIIPYAMNWGPLL